MSFSPVNPTATNGTATLGSAYVIATNNAYEYTGLSITLPAAGTYFLTYSALTDIYSASVGASVLTKLYNFTDSADVPGSVQQGSYCSTSMSNYLSSQSVGLVVTVTASKVIRLYAKIQTSGGGTVLQRTVDIASVSYVKLAWLSLGRTSRCMAILSRAQLIDRLGGPTAARQLLDPQNTSDPATGAGFFNDRLDASIREAEGDIVAAYGSRYVGATANPSDKLTRIAGQLAEYYAWGRNKSKTMPETVKQFYGAARADLKDIEASDSAPGGDTVSRFPRYIDNSRGGRRAVASSWRRGGPNGGSW